MRWFLTLFCYTHTSVPCPVIIRGQQQASGSRYRHPQWRKSKCEVSIRFLPSELSESWGTGWKDYWGQRKWKTSGKLSQLSRLLMSSQRLQLQAWKLCGSTPDPLSMLWLSAQCFCRTPVRAGVGVSLIVLPALETRFLLLGCLIQPQYEVCAFSYFTVCGGFNRYVPHINTCRLVCLMLGP